MRQLLLTPQQDLRGDSPGWPNARGQEYAGLAPPGRRYYPLSSSVRWIALSRYG